MAQGALACLKPGTLSRPVSESLWEGQAGPVRSARSPAQAADRWGRPGPQGAGPVAKVTGKLGPAQGLCVLGQSSLQGLSRHPWSPERGPRSPIQDHQEQWVRGWGFWEIFSSGIQLAWCSDPTHLLKVASVQHTGPENTEHVSELATLVPSWPWCRLVALFQWVPRKTMGALLPPLFPWPLFLSLTSPFLPRLSEEPRHGASAPGPLHLLPECLSVPDSP